jgi:hypothetical protein
MSAKESCRQLVEQAQARGHRGCKQQGHRGRASQPPRTHSVTPHALDTGHRVIVFRVWSSGFQAHFGLILPYSCSLLE